MKIRQFIAQHSFSYILAAIGSLAFLSLLNVSYIDYKIFIFTHSQWEFALLHMSQWFTGWWACVSENTMCITIQPAYPELLAIVGVIAVAKIDKILEKRKR